MTKSEARAIMKQIRLEMTKSQVKEQSKLIMNRIMSFELFQKADNCLTYVSFGDEVDTSSWLKEQLSNRSFRKKLFVPKVIKNEMEFYHITTYDQLSPGIFGIPEPVIEEAFSYRSLCADKGCSVMLLPGLAFDKKGNRVGYGGGYYDRYLSSYKREQFIKIAVSFEVQIVDRIEKEEYDVGVDYIVTPDRIYNCRCEENL